MENIEKNKIVSRGTLEELTREKLLEEVKALPSKPGVYQYFNNKNEIIYVGKAKNLKNRVSSYFGNHQLPPKTYVLVKNIAYLKYIVVADESDALLLENNLIKTLQPRYNVMLKDDKTYPSVCITKENFPRIYKTRNLEKNGSEYFGPYASAYALNYLLEVVHSIFPLRTCRLPLTPENIAKKKFKVCLKYHLHSCNGVCEGKESAAEYNEYIEQVREIIKGNANEISKLLLKKIKELSENLEFEKAHSLKQKYDLLEKFKTTTVIANSIIHKTDVFGYDETENSAFVSIFRVQNGAIIQGMTIELKKQIDETREELLETGIVQLRERLESDSHEIILPFEIEFSLKDLKITIPLRGDRKKLLDLAMQNVRQYKMDKLKQAEKLNPEQRKMQLLKEIQDRLGLPKIPHAIECFDNSNIQGSDAVAACVVYKNGRPSKKDYRKYIIKTVEGADDYASMREVARRRYGRMLEEEMPLPDLIVADGGAGQMEAIRQVTEDELKLQIPIAGLAKNDKHRTNEILVGFPPQIIGVKPTDTLFRFFAAMQDEVHRFAIKFHREKRSKRQTASELDEIKGVGENTKNELLLHFKSVKRIKNASLEELSNLIGTRRASAVYEHFHKLLIKN